MVSSYCTTWNYTQSIDTNLWDANRVLQELLNSTVFYMNTHGGEPGLVADYLQTDRYDYSLYYPGDPPDPNLDYEFITGTNNAVYYYYPVLPRRVIANAYGYPPFNRLMGNQGPGTPPITLAFLDGCGVGVHAGEYATGFLYPFQNAYSSGLIENQAVCAYLIEVEAWATRETQGAFWGALNEGWTVDWGRQFAYDKYTEFGFEVPDREEDWMTIEGDPATRLRGVYTGTSGQDTRKWRPLW